MPMPSFRYYSVEDVFAKGPPAMEGPDILVGNSATATNNHVEAFNLLAGCDLNGRRIIVPLSYFDEAYADAVVRLGRELFGDRFVPLREFVPIERYNKTVASCGTVIMNHVRGQAMGNLTTALYKGAKLFLRPENPYLRFYADHGAHLFSLSQDAVDPKTIFTPLSDEQKAQNKRIVESIWGFDAVVEHIRWMIRDVTKENGGIDELDRGNSSTLV